jgi:hypothetical protein
LRCYCWLLLLRVLLELLLLKLFAGVVAAADWRGKEAALEVALLGEEEVAAVMGSEVELLREWR